MLFIFYVTLGSYSTEYLVILYLLESTSILVVDVVTLSFSVGVTRYD